MKLRRHKSGRDVVWWESGERVTMNSITFLVIFSVGVSNSFRLDSRIPVSRTPNSCTTLTGSTCVFPFKYKVRFPRR